MTTTTAKPSSLVNALKLGWPALLVVVATFVAAEIITGTSWGGGPIGGVAGGIGVGGVAWVEAHWPDESLARKRTLIAGLALAVSVATLTVLQLLRLAGIL